MKKTAVILFLLSTSALVWSQPYIPADDTQVLIEIEQTERLQALKLLRQQLDRDNSNLTLLSRVISDYLKLGREHADERYFSYAEALLTPYINNDMLDTSLKVQWADILQRQHQFDKASQILDQVLAITPGHTRARLMRAVIYQAKGQYVPAMQDCKALLGQVELLIAATCIAQIDALQGHLARSSQLLQQTLARYGSSDEETLAWSRTVLAEMKLRSGHEQEALVLLDEVLNSHARDYYALAIKADILLQQGRYGDVISLLRPHQHVSKLLLRLVIAANYSGQQHSHDRNRLSAIIERAQMFAEGAHKRLLARYYLDVTHTPLLALKAARDNWREQREPDDALLLARCLLAVNALDELHEFRQSLSRAGRHDQRIDSLFSEVSS